LQILADSCDEKRKKRMMDWLERDCVLVIETEDQDDEPCRLQILGVHNNLTSEIIVSLPPPLPSRYF